MIKDGLRTDGYLSAHIFNKMQHEVLYTIEQVTYRNFLMSDMYLYYINRHPHLLLGSSNSSSSEEPSTLVSRSSTLPTLHEDAELVHYDSTFGLPTTASSCVGAVGGGGATSRPMTLTRDALRATEQRRLEMRPTM